MCVCVCVCVCRLSDLSGAHRNLKKQWSASERDFSKTTVSCRNKYHICPYRGRARIEGGAQIVAGGQEASSLIVTGSK